MKKLDYKDLLEVTYTNKDNDVYAMSIQNKVLLVFLRHFGCVFCRQTMADLSKIRNTIASEGTKIVVVHMSEDAVADSFLDRFGLEGIEHISDPDMSLYQYFGLYQGTFGELYGLNVWFKGVLKAVKYGTTVGKKLGDYHQMPGAFLIENGQVLKEFDYQGDITKRPFDNKVDTILDTENYHRFQS